MCFNMAMVSSNISSNNEEDMKNFEFLRHKVQGPGFMLIVTGNSYQMSSPTTRKCSGKSLKRPTGSL